MGGPWPSSLHQIGSSDTSTNKSTHREVQGESELIKQYHPGGGWGIGEGQSERGDARPDSRGLENHQHAVGIKQCSVQGT